jgi:hypothetical protein
VTRSCLRWTPLALALLAAACGDGPTPPSSLDCAGVSPTSLGVGEYTIIDGTQAACVRLPAAGSSETEHLYVALSGAGTESQGGTTAPYTLQGGSGSAAARTPATAVFDHAPSAAQGFHDRLRARELELSRQPAVVAASRRRISASAAAIPPVVGAKRTFEVCATTSYESFVQSSATVQAVGQRVAIFVDDAAPAGFSQAELDNVVQLFDTQLYPIDTTAFGQESDLDQNNVVVVLLTQRVNELSPDCQTTGSAILGYFFGLDLLPAQLHSNDGEIFYSAVPGTVANGCSLPKSSALAELPGVFIHEFQHMISFNQHVLVKGGTGEDTWLNEGLSHYAEELGGENVPDAFCQPTFANCETQFNGGNISNAYGYLNDPEASFLVEPATSTGTLNERGANWLFVRWLTDHFSSALPKATDVTRALVQTDRVGAANVAAVTSEDFGTLVGQWQLANYLTNLSGFSPSSDRLQYTTLNLRGIYQTNFNDGVFAKPYPLTPDQTDGNYSHSGTLRAGSGRHLRVLQAPGAAEVSLLLTGANGSGSVDANAVPLFAVARIR